MIPFRIVVCRQRIRRCHNAIIIPGRCAYIYIFSWRLFSKARGHLFIHLPEPKGSYNTAGRISPMHRSLSISCLSQMPRYTIYLTRLVVPIPKSTCIQESKTLPNFRPISLLAIICDIQSKNLQFTWIAWMIVLCLGLWELFLYECNL